MLPDSLNNIASLIGLSSKNDIRSWKSIEPGLSSRLWKLETTRGDFVLKQALTKLRVKDDWYISPHRNKNEYNYLKALTEAGFEYTPKVLNYECQKNYFIMDYIDSPYPNWKTKLISGNFESIEAFKAGDILGKLHSFFLERPDLFQTFNDKDLYFQTRLSPYWVTLFSKHPELKKYINRAIEISLKKKITIIHGDASPKNFLILSDKLLLLDAECAFWGDPAYDFAFLLTHLFLKSYAVPSYLSSLILMIREPLVAYLPYISWEPSKCFLERVQFYLPILLLARIDGKAAVEYLDPNQKEFIRSFIKAQILKDTKLSRCAHSLPSVYETWHEAFLFLKTLENNRK